MLGTIVNSLAIVIGGLVGVLIGKGFKEGYKDTVVKAISLAVILVGLKGAFSGMESLSGIDFVLVIVFMALGGVIGEMLNIEGKLTRVGDFVSSKFKGQGGFTKGFVSASLVYCVGSMAVMGSLESGIRGIHDILYAKAALDGISSVVFASSLGIGVAFSAVPVFIYQGAITIMATWIAPLLSELVIAQMSVIGGLLILGIGINIMEIGRIKIGNMLPGLFVPIIYLLIRGIF